MEHLRRARLVAGARCEEALQLLARLLLAAGHARGLERLGAALPRLIEVGGSHAQRDLFEQVYLEAVLRDGRLANAQQILELRRGFDPDGVPLNRTLARVYDDLGLPDLSAQAAFRAKSTQDRRAHERHAY